MRQWLLKFGKQLVFWLSVLFLGFLTTVSLVSTTYFNAETSFEERPSYRLDFLPLNLLLLALVFLFLWQVGRRIDWDRISEKWICAAAVLFVTGVSFLWIFVSHTYPEADQKAVSWMAYLMSIDNFLFFQPGKYMQIYPNQLGLTALMELLYRLAGKENWKLFMCLTAISNGALVFLLFRLTALLFQKKKTTVLVLLLSMGCMQLFLYTTFLYGITLGLSFSLAAFYFLLLFLNQEKFWQGFLSGICIGAAVLIKNNYSIFLVAMVLLLFWEALSQKKGKLLLLAVWLLLASALMGKALTAFYEERSGIELSDGMPKSMWIAMGMQEGERAEGWYNGFNYDTFLETGCDREKSDAIAREAIRESLENFKQDPAYALRFYYKKTVSQWNEPTYEALWVNQFHQGDFTRIVQSIYDGKLYHVFHEYMNFYQSLLFVGALAAFLILRGRFTLRQMFFAIVILGGFFFHTLWEAKSQYIFPYFVILIPYGAEGLSKLLDLKTEGIFHRRK